MRLIDADKVPQLSDMIGCAYEGGEYQAYMSGAEYGRGIGKIVQVLPVLQRTN